MSTMSIIARALLRDSWTHLQVALAPTVRPAPAAPPPRAPSRPWPVGAIVVHQGGGPPRMVLGYKPDGRCMSAYISAPPWMQRSLSLRVLIDDARDLRAVDPKRDPVELSASPVAEERS